MQLNRFVGLTWSYAIIGSLHIVQKLAKTFDSLCSSYFALFPRVGPWHPSFPLVHLLPHIFHLLFSISFIGFTYFLLLFIPSLSTRIVPLRFQAIWILMFCSIWFSLVLCVSSVLRHYWLGHLTRKNPSPIWPMMCLVGR